MIAAYLDNPKVSKMTKFLKENPSFLKTHLKATTKKNKGKSQIVY
jgi:hypothetical protein